MGAISWPEAFMLVGLFVSLAFMVAAIARGPRIIHVHHDDEEVEDGE